MDRLTPDQHEPNPSLRTFARAAVRFATEFIERAATLDGATDDAAGLVSALEEGQWKDFAYQDSGEAGFFTVIVPADKMPLFRPVLEHFGAKVYGPSTRALLATLDRE